MLPTLSRRAAAASTQSRPSIAASLIAAAQPHIAVHGFTLAAVRAAIDAPSPASSSASTSHLQLDAKSRASLNDWNLGRLFPGSPTAETSIPISLLRKWDQDRLDEITATFPAAGPHAKGSGDFEAAVATLCQRLAGSQPVRNHLLEPFSYLSATRIPMQLLNLLPGRALLAALPIKLPDSIPSPLPLFARASHIADVAATLNRIDQRFGAEWYTTRAQLAAAYLAAELHMVASNSDLSASQSVLRKVANVGLGGSRRTADVATHSRPWPTATYTGGQTSAGARTLHTSARSRAEIVATTNRKQKRHSYSTLPDQSQVARTFATPFGDFVSTVSSIARVIIKMALGVFASLLIAFEAVHLYVEHSAMKSASAKSPEEDPWGWHSEMAEDASWGSGSKTIGTDPRLGILGRHILRSAWVYATWGAGIDPDYFFNAGSAPGTGGANAAKSSRPGIETVMASKTEGDGLVMTERLLAFVVRIAESRGIKLPDVAAMRAGLVTAHDAGADAPLDATALALETKLAAVRERLGTTPSLTRAIAGYERIFDALSATEHTREAVGPSSGQPAISSARLARLANKLGVLNASAGNRKEAEGWLLKAIHLAGHDSVVGTQVQADVLAKLPNAEATSATSSWFGRWRSNRPKPTQDPPATPSTAATDEQQAAAKTVSPSVSRAIVSSLLSLSALYASSPSSTITSPSDSQWQASLRSAMQTQVTLLQLIAQELARNVSPSSDLGKELHTIWLSHQSALANMHLAETLYALGPSSSHVKGMRETLATLSTAAPIATSLPAKHLILAELTADEILSHLAVTKARRASNDTSIASATQSTLPRWKSGGSGPQSNGIQSVAVRLLRDAQRVKGESRSMVRELERMERASGKK
ncbi:unnamed protein product [Jaminaea pallidilutea]